MPLNHKYFTFEELIYSEDALKKYDIRNKTTQTIESNLDRLITELLDPIREMWGKPLQVSSGFRCDKLNGKVRGSKTSRHKDGLAADLDAGTNADNKALAKMIAASGLKFDQLIDEKGYAWVHVGLTTKDRTPRQEILRTKDGIKYTRLTPDQL